MRCWYYWGKDDHQRAIDASNQLLGVSPGDVLALLVRGSSYAVDSQFDKAIVNLAQALKLGSGSLLIRKQLALARFYRGSELFQKLAARVKFMTSEKTAGHESDLETDLDRVVADLSETLRLDPEKAEAYFIRGVLSCSRHDFAQSIADLSHFVKLQPGEQRGREQLARAYCERARSNSRSDTSLSIADCNEALRHDPRLADAYRIRGEAHMERGDFDQAIVDLNTAMQMDPNGEGSKLDASRSGHPKETGGSTPQEGP